MREDDLEVKLALDLEIFIVSSSNIRLHKEWAISVVMSV